MMRRRWLLVTLVVGILTLGITGGAILAQSNGSGEDSSPQSFAGRVAAILGLEEAQVQDAMDQARREMQTERLQHKLDRLVERGRITEEQADEIMEWYQARPEGLPWGLPGHGPRVHRLHPAWMWGAGGRHGMGIGHEPSQTPEQ